MRQDIDKVLFERQRGNSSERSQKTRLKVNPKFFQNNHRHHTSFEDFRSHMLEICDGWEDPSIINGVDYTYEDGAMFLSSARHRQEGHGRFYKRRNENTKPLYRFLRKNVGRPWNDVYSEICAFVDVRSDTGYQVMEHLGWAVAKDIMMYDDKPYQTRWSSRTRWWELPYTGLYIHPESGILCEGEPRRWSFPKSPVTSIHWHDDTWFNLEVLKDRNTDCGCVHFKIPPLPEDKDKKGYFQRYDDRPAVCVHGHEPTPRPIWYVCTYAWHKPDEVYRVIHHYEYQGPYYGLKDGEIHTIYYRDVPDILAIPTTQHKKVANKKELKFIHEYLKSGSAHQPSPEPRKSR
jgi:hypothetical protein